MIPLLPLIAFFSVRFSLSLSLNFECCVMYIDNLKSFEADLDDTLYHGKTGIAEACKRNIEGRLDFFGNLRAENSSVLAMS